MLPPSMWKTKPADYPQDADFWTLYLQKWHKQFGWFFWLYGNKEMVVAELSALNELFVQKNSRVFMKDDGSEGCFPHPPLPRPYQLSESWCFSRVWQSSRKILAICIMTCALPGQWTSETGEKEIKKRLRAKQEVFVFNRYIFLSLSKSMGTQFFEVQKRTHESH